MSTSSSRSRATAASCFVRRTARKVSVHPRNASIGIGEDGGLAFRRSKPGAALDVRRAERLLSKPRSADGSSIVRLSVHPVAAKIEPAHHRTHDRRACGHEPPRSLRGIPGDAQLGRRHGEARIRHAGRRVDALSEAREPHLVQPGAGQLGRRTARGRSRWTREPDGHAGPVHHGTRPDQDPRDDVSRIRSGATRPTAASGCTTSRSRSSTSSFRWGRRSSSSGSGPRGRRKETSRTRPTARTRLPDLADLAPEPPPGACIGPGCAYPAAHATLRTHELLEEPVATIALRYADRQILDRGAPART